MIRAVVRMIYKYSVIYRRYILLVYVCTERGGGRGLVFLSCNLAICRSFGNNDLTKQSVSHLERSHKSSFTSDIKGD